MPIIQLILSEIHYSTSAKHCLGVHRVSALIQIFCLLCLQRKNVMASFEGVTTLDWHNVH